VHVEARLEASRAVRGGLQARESNETDASSERLAQSLGDLPPTQPGEADIVKKGDRITVSLALKDNGSAPK
jgi:hypothetical protein